MIKRDLPGYAIGGLSGGEAKNEFWRVVEQCTRPGAGLPEQKPRYLMGVGYPLDIVICVALGVDMFDCVYPCRTARFGTALVRSGQLRLTSAEFANDFRPPITSSRSFCFYLFLIFLCIFCCISSRFLFDFLHLTFQCLRPLEPGGKGPLKEYTRAMLHSIVTKETVAAQLITWHNLWFMLNLLMETWMIWSW